MAGESRFAARSRCWMVLVNNSSTANCRRVNMQEHRRRPRRRGRLRSGEGRSDRHTRRHRGFRRMLYMHGGWERCDGRNIGWRLSAVAAAGIVQAGRRSRRGPSRRAGAEVTIGQAGSACRPRWAAVWRRTRIRTGPDGAVSITCGTTPCFRPAPIPAWQSIASSRFDHPRRSGDDFAAPRHPQPW